MVVYDLRRAYFYWKKNYDRHDEPRRREKVNNRVKTFVVRCQSSDELQQSLVDFLLSLFPKNGKNEIGSLKYIFTWLKWVSDEPKMVKYIRVSSTMSESFTHSVEEFISFSYKLLHVTAKLAIFPIGMIHEKSKQTDRKKYWLMPWMGITIKGRSLCRARKRQMELPDRSHMQGGRLPS